MFFTNEVVGSSEENNCDDDTVDCDGFTENDTDQILRLDTRHLNSGTQQTATCDEDTPRDDVRISCSYQAAPIMDNPRESATPT